jgi:hypothetical protein
MHLSASMSTPQGTQADYENLSKGVKSWMNETTARLPDVPFDVSALSLGGLDPRRIGGRVVAPGVTVKDEKVFVNVGQEGEVYIKQEHGAKPVRQA